MFFYSFYFYLLQEEKAMKQHAFKICADHNVEMLDEFKLLAMKH